MLERDAELEQLATAFTRVRDGVGGLMVVEGPAGIGKTRLLQAAHSLALESGLTTLSARGGPLERDFAFGIVRQLLGPGSLAGAAFEGLARDALEALELLPPAAAPAAARVDPASAEGVAAIVQGVYWALATLADGAALVLVIDDSQWTDAPSWRLIAYLARRLEDQPIMVVLGARSGLDEDREARLGEVTSAPAAEVVALHPLSEDASAELVRERLGAGAHESFCEACHHASAGNPFLLAELIGHLQGARSRTVGGERAAHRVTEARERGPLGAREPGAARWRCGGVCSRARDPRHRRGDALGAAARGARC